MRRPRFKAPSEHPLAYYHCISRVVDRRFAFGPPEKEQFVRFMRLYERFCGVRVVTYCVMSNHFHVLLEAPKRPSQLPDDEELLKRLAAVYRGSGGPGAGTIRQHLAFLRQEGAHAEAEAYRERFFARMWDVSAFMKLLKQRFTQWFNRTHGRKGTLWEERFKSVLVEGAGTALATMAAYIDMNPVRAGVVSDPKEYRWCGYAAAVAGVKEARVGLRVVAEAVRGEAVVAQMVLREYRVLLYGTGEAEGLGEDGRPLRAGFAREEVEAVLAAKGRLDRWQMLRCRVRYLTDGVALGTRSFVNEVFAARREHFGPKRTSGARAMQGVDAAGLFTLRDLRVGALG
jgi:REP element-mobilizing transposase RayT